MIHDPHTYILARTIALRDAPGQPIRCAYGGELILDPAHVGSDPTSMATLRHGNVVLDDTVYVARGPAGEYYLCLGCAVRLGIARGAPIDNPIAPPPARAGALLWARRWPLLAWFGGVLVALTVFELFVEDVGNLEGAPWDRPILHALRGSAALARGPVPRAIALLGDLSGTVPACALIVLALSLRRRGRDALCVGLAYGGALVANVAINVLFSALNEYWGAPGLGPAGGYVSRAAMVSLALLSALTVLAWPTQWRWSALALAAPVIVLVGVARVALGADDPSDVLGGWAGSLVWTIGVSLILRTPLAPDTPGTGTAAGRPPAAK
jgi:membrane-associated phospholipid phosphatase